MTHLAEDDGLGDGDGSIDIADGLELFFSAVAQHIVLLDGVQRFFLFLELDDIGVQHDDLGKVQHGLLKGSREK